MSEIKDFGPTDTRRKVTEEKLPAFDQAAIACVQLGGTNITNIVSVPGIDKPVSVSACGPSPKVRSH